MHGNTIRTWEILAAHENAKMIKMRIRRAPSKCTNRFFVCRKRTTNQINSVFVSYMCFIIFVISSSHCAFIQYFDSYSDYRLESQISLEFRGIAWVAIHIPFMFSFCLLALHFCVSFTDIKAPFELVFSYSRIRFLYPENSRIITSRTLIIHK